MDTKTNKFQSCGAYAHSVAHRVRRPQVGRINKARLQFPSHVLIVEFRDEVYASLCQVLNEEGLVVTRAETATEVAAKAGQLPYAMVLINEAMPGESGWLISSKLRLSNSQRRVWVYTAKQLRYLQDWQTLAGVENVLSYSGDLLRLIRTLRAQIRLQQQAKKMALPHKAVNAPISDHFLCNPFPKQSRIGHGTTWSMIPLAMPLALSLISLMPGSSTFAKCGGGCSGGSCPSGASSTPGVGSIVNPAGSSMRTGSMQNTSASMQSTWGSSEFIPLPPQTGPHGGILSMLQKHQAEVVFAPRETRVYLYSSTGEPLPVRGVQGHVVMKIRGIPKKYSYDLQESSDGRNDSFLLLRVDASRLRDGDMEATFELARLPSRDERRARFVQTFALTQPAAMAPSAPEPRQTVEVRQVAVTAADRPLIARQKNCPVTGEPLASMGGPIKLMIGEQPLFVCCEGCIDQVKSNPTMMLAKINH